MYSTVIAQKKDICKIVEIAHQTWPQTYGNILSQDQIDYMLNLMYDPVILEQQMDNGVLFVLIVEGGLPFGFIGFELLEKDAARYTKVHKLYVLPHYHGKGAGKALIDVARKHSLENGVSVLELNVNKYNQSVDFYLRNGFKIKEEMILDIGNGFIMDDFIMQKDLT